MKFTRINPLTGDIASEAEAMKPEMIDDIAEKAQVAFSIWTQQGPNHRQTIPLSPKLWRMQGSAPYP